MIRLVQKPELGRKLLKHPKKGVDQKSEESINQP